MFLNVQRRVRAMEESLEHYVEEDVHGDGGEGEAELLPAEGASVGEGGLINQEPHPGGEGEADLLPTDGSIDGEGGLRSLCLHCFEMYVTWFPFFLGRFSKQVHQGVSCQSNDKIQRARWPRLLKCCLHFPMKRESQINILSTSQTEALYSTTRSAM